MKKVYRLVISFKNQQDFIMRLILSVFLLALSSFSFADSILTITPVVDFPASVVQQRASVATYTVKNIWANTIPNAHLTDLTATGAGVVTQVASTVAGACNFPSSLTAGQSCTLTLSFSGPTGAQFTNTTFKICANDTNTVCRNLSADQVQTTTVVAAPTTEMPTLSTATARAFFSPGDSTTLVVHNTGPSTVNEIAVALPSSLQAYVDTAKSTLSCASTAPNADCTLHIAMSDSLPTSTDDGELSVQASNSKNALNVTTHVGILSVNAVLITQPGTEYFTVHNDSNVDVTNLALIQYAGIKIVIFAGDKSTCSAELASGQSCVFAYTAYPRSSGTAVVRFEFTPSGGSATSISSTLSIAHTQVAINPNGEDVGQDIPGNTATKLGSFVIKNTGQFDWLAPSIQPSTGDSWLSLSTTSCNVTIIPGASCTMNYSIGDDHNLTSVITASGTNLDATRQNFLPSNTLSIGVEADSGYQHLGYRALKVSNLTTSAHTLATLIATPPEGENITLCDKTGSNCSSAFASTCLDFSRPLAANTGICHIWYKANSIQTIKADQVATVTVSLTTQDDTSASSNIQFTYGSDLYAGGEFTTAGGGEMQYIAKWDGSNWSALNNSVNSSVYALALDANSDLVAGGTFSQADYKTAERIATWNGDDWSTLGQGMSSTVTALTVNAAGELIAGGWFTEADELSVNYIAAWDGSSWSALDGGMTGNRVYSLAATTEGGFVAGGFFTKAGQEPASNIAQRSDGAWSALGAGLGGSVESLVESTPNNIVAGGQFNVTGDNLAVKGVAAWNGNTWSALGDGLDGIVYSLAKNSLGNIVAGGVFRSSGATPVNNIALWNSSSWTALGDGLNGSVRAIAITATNDIFAGGNFTEAGGEPANYIAQWNGTSWSALGEGMNNKVLSLAFAPRISLDVSITGQHK
jgi:hypothetical protein